jgi:hypothetical protein
MGINTENQLDEWVRGNAQHAQLAHVRFEGLSTS